VTDAMTFCASDVPVTFRLNDPKGPADVVTLPASVRLVGPPIRMPSDRETPFSRMLFKFVIGEDPGRKIGRRLRTNDLIEWDGRTLIVLGTAVPTRVDSEQRYATTDVWMIFAELIC
jgi:hypothetical protein